MRYCGDVQTTNATNETKMSIFGHHYPAGAEHDPRAPWNQPGACEACDGDGRIILPAEDGDDEPDFETCQECDGTGREKTAADLRTEMEEAKADMERDEE